MCQAMIDSVRSYAQPADQPKKELTAADVPLGDGLAQQARLSILSRRARIDQALEEAERGRERR